MAQAAERSVAELKDALDAGAGAEGMVEELSGRCAELGEELEAVRSALADAEEAAELAAEVQYRRARLRLSALAGCPASSPPCPCPPARALARLHHT
jgi:hypothetical protein